MIPLGEATRRLLIQAFVGEVICWKGDDIAETVVFGAKNPAIDVDDVSFYSITKAGLLADNPASFLNYIGTTTLGKDGRPAVIIFNDGTTVVLSCETPLAGQPGAMANLYVVKLVFRVGAEPLGSGVADLTSRNAINKIITALRVGTNSLPPLV